MRKPGATGSYTVYLNKWLKSCSTFFSVAVIRQPENKQLRRTKFCFSWQFQIPVQRRKDAKAPETWNSRSYHTASQEQREVSTHVPLACLFSAGILYAYTIQDPLAREWCYPRWDECFYLENVKTSSQRYASRPNWCRQSLTETCFPGDPRLCQVHN